ncbi:alkenal/one oxidoreductase, chloroplastic [Seminavis robusta]|uniref:Alkenal/one oxidoreductase, chloroplastic n=1 Tax=Seminavis robusta TaxID=568900 RepID=A0A9N8E754_9STRA|nr:alkenal/one oxidoreductase, chloroplastic [Seminavis robusta]|eukprot:Sro693_g188380.1 alkenal/one oxidoreductase, chloroplastic (348) ;mRNA; f:45760-46803
MKAAIATGFGDIDKNIQVVEDWPVPTLKAKDEILVKVSACALAPGDVRVLSGKTDWIQLPKGGHPYVVGGDLSGVVISSNSKTFKPGDYVVSRFELPGPSGALGEYKVVKESLTEHCPESIDPIQSCGLTASTMAAKKIVDQCVNKGDRVLVIGGSGAVGSSVLQYAKLAGAAHVVAVSSQEDLCKSLGADSVIDYRNQNWWQMPEYQTDPFDVAIDLVGGENWEQGGCSGAAIKRKGFYVALPPGVQSDIELHGCWGLVSLSFQWLWLVLWTTLHPKVPRNVMPDGLDLRDGDLREMLNDVVEGRIKPVVDPSSPFEFNSDSVREAFHLQGSKHAHGKVVVKITDA